MIHIQNGKVFNSEFQDIYFSQEDGESESDYVFLKGNHLEQRFQALQSYESFSVGELGFGTGLNFLLTRRLFLKEAHPSTRLEYISFEIDLPSPPLCRKSNSLFPSLKNDAILLRRKLRGVLQRNTGTHTILFDSGRIKLTLFLGDVRTEIFRMQGNCHAWYLDGFAPSKNPQMWQVSIFRELANRSHPGATFSSFSAAGGVRQSLKESGFEVERIPGFGRKKHMIRGQLLSRHLQPEASHPGVSIVGGGLAGLATAYALTRRGVHVTLYEANDIASGASGNMAGMATAGLTAEPTNLSLLGIRAQSLFVSWLMDQQGDWKRLGLVRKRDDVSRYSRARETHKLMNVYQSSRRREALVGWTAAVNPGKLCQFYLQKCLNSGLFELHNATRVDAQQIQQDASNPDKDQDSVWILCNANELGEFPQTQFIVHSPVRGQVLHIPLTGTGLRFPVTNQIYVVPNPLNAATGVLGATFDMHLSDSQRLPQRDDYLLKEMQQRLGEIWNSLSEESKRGLLAGHSEGRVGFRCQARDYVPVCGSLPDPGEFLKRHDRHYTLPVSTRKNHLHQWSRELIRNPGLYVNACHGSRGITSTFLCAEIIASDICGETAPVETDLLFALDPARFLWKVVSQPPDKRPDWARAG